MRSGRPSLLLVVLLVIACLLAACGSTTAPPSGDDTSTTLPADLERLAGLVDAARAEARACGDGWFDAVPPLAADARLRMAAQLHSDDMHTNGFMGHVGSDGSRLGDRVARQGYGWSSLGENVAAGYGTPEAVMAGWLASPGHCANLMRASYVHLGLGRTGDFWTQVFGRP